MKMDIFKNVQNEKAGGLFENGNSDFRVFAWWPSKNAELKFWYVSITFFATTISC